MTAVRIVPSTGSRSPEAAPGYVRRRPEQTLLYELVAAEAGGLREALTRASAYGRGLPRHVDKELDALLECGLLHRGFARVRCRRCRSEHLVAFSCKGRGLCPSCTSRRMSDTAAHLLDRVLPRGVRYRQWVVTFAPRVRHHLAADPSLASLALRQCLRAIFAWQRRAARRGGVRPARARSNAAVAFVQRFNSALELSLHFHVLIPDAVFIPDETEPDARPRTVALEPPTDAEVAALLDEIMARVTRLLRRRGRLCEAVDEREEQPELMALGPARRAGPSKVTEPPPPRCARKAGYSLHAGRSVHPNDRAGLEALCRYGLRPPLSQGRLHRKDDGTFEYPMKRRFSDGTQVLRFEPRELLLRLCALVPPPRFHMVRYAGVLAPHARGRYALTGRGMHEVAGTRPARRTPTWRSTRRAAA